MATVLGGAIGGRHGWRENIAARVETDRYPSSDCRTVARVVALFANRAQTATSVGDACKLLRFVKSSWRSRQRFPNYKHRRRMLSCVEFTKRHVRSAEAVRQIRYGIPRTNSGHPQDQPEERDAVQCERMAVGGRKEGVHGNDYDWMGGNGFHLNTNSRRATHSGQCRRARMPRPPRVDRASSGLDVAVALSLCGAWLAWQVKEVKFALRWSVIWLVRCRCTDGQTIRNKLRREQRRAWRRGRGWSRKAMGWGWGATAVLGKTAWRAAMWTVRDCGCNGDGGPVASTEGDRIRKRCESREGLGTSEARRTSSKGGEKGAAAGAIRRKSEIKIAAAGAARGAEDEKDAAVGTARRARYKERTAAVAARMARASANVSPSNKVLMKRPWVQRARHMLLLAAASNLTMAMLRVVAVGATDGDWGGDGVGGELWLWKLKRRWRNVK